MGLESFTYITSLNASNPVTGDNKTEGDDHIRGTKTTLLNSFPAVSGAVTATHTELNYVDGVTSAIQTQLNAKAATASPTFTGTAAFATITASGTIAAIGNIGTSGALSAAGVVYGNGGGNGLGSITVSTSAPSGGAAGDIWIQY